MNIASVKKVRRAQLDGFTMGLLAGCVVLNDVHDFSDDELKDYINDCETLVGSISKGETDARYCVRELENMTGIKLKFVNSQ